MTKRLWILGAADPEMAAIEKLLLDAGETVGHATADGVRVHPGNAYRATAYCIGTDIGTAWSEDLILVECGGFPDCRFVDATTTVVDHHRPGDPGYGKPPAEYWTASSLGQVCGLLSSLYHGIYGDEPGEDCYDGYVRVCIYQSQLELDDFECVYVENAHLIAAADHCLAAAYRCECPGVNPDELMQWRVRSRAEFQGRPEADVLADVNAARQKLQDAVTEWQENEDHTGYIPGPGRRAWADLRGEVIPELPEAACREGIPYVAETRERATQCHCSGNDSACPECDGVGTVPSRRKVVLGAASAELVRRFMSGSVVPGLTGIYGDPARGFAGGYLA